MQVPNLLRVLGVDERSRHTAKWFHQFFAPRRTAKNAIIILQLEVEH